MSINEHLRIGKLNDYYGNLLTAQQSEAVRLYYDCDMSLAEIAEEAGISRQAVHDMLTRATFRLEQFEQKLGLINKIDDVCDKLCQLHGALDNLQNTQIKAQLQAIINKIKEI